MDQGTEVEQLIAACEKLLTDDLRTPPGSPDSLALCGLDAVWSLGVRYGSVENVLDRYRRWVSGVADGDADRRDAHQLVEDIAVAGGPVRFAEDAIDNRARTSPRSGILKAEAVRLAAALPSSTEVGAPTGVSVTTEGWSSQVSSGEPTRPEARPAAMRGTRSRSRRQPS